MQFQTALDTFLDCGGIWGSFVPVLRTVIEGQAGQPLGKLREIRNQGRLQ
jgi:hypothetical protein